MRDPKRIDRIAKMIGKAWHYVPDFRFWQFITYLVEYFPDEWAGGDLFYAEDDVWKSALDNMIQSYKEREEDDDLR